MGKEKQTNQQYIPKHITVDLRGQQTATAGEAVSNRHVINVKDESGKKVRGFFSVKTSASIEQDFNARISRIQKEMEVAAWTV